MLDKLKYTHEYYTNKDIIQHSRQRGFERVDIKHQKVIGDFYMPLRKTEFSAGYDFLLPNEIILKPKTSYLIWTDIKAYMLKDEFLQIHIRSSTAIKHDVRIKNIVGICDSDYYSNLKNDGNIGICLYNFGDKTFYQEKGTGIVQGIFLTYFVSDNCNTNNKRVGGIGSTD